MGSCMGCTGSPSTLPLNQPTSFLNVCGLEVGSSLNWPFPLIISPLQTRLPALESGFPLPAVAAPPEP